jgi:hypothetical protein
MSHRVSDTLVVSPDAGQLTIEVFPMLQTTVRHHALGRTMRRAAAIALVSAFALSLPSSLLARTAESGDQDSDVSLTVYSTADPAGFDPQQFIAQQRSSGNPRYADAVPGFGVVKEVRTVDLKAGLGTLRFTDVAQFIDPTTVSFTDIENPAATRVVEQRFLFDLVNREKLLEKFIDQKVTIRRSTGGDKFEEITGTLLSAEGYSLTLMTDKGVLLASANDVQLGKLPGGLITRPTLEWKLQADNPGQRKVRTTYQTNGLTWRADYNLVVSADDKTADLGAWVTLMNLSGTGYENARLKLIAGDVQRITPKQSMGGMGRKMRMAAMDMAKNEAAGFEEKSFFEYHLYTLPRRTTISQNSTQQITLFPTARNVNVQKVLVYYGLPEEARYWFFAEPAADRDLGNQSNKKVDVYFRIKNAEANQMGMPLPKGKIRVYKQDAPTPGKPGDGSLEFVGEDVIDHTAKNETLLVKLGQSFDVKGERKQTNFTIDNARKVITESYSITLTNAKKEPAKVIVKENLFRWSNWDITQKSDAFEKVDSRTIHFEVDVPAEGSKKVDYTVRYTW